MKTYNVIGLMSGTSLDGLDIAFCNFKSEHHNWTFEIQEAHTFSYDKRLVEKLQNAHLLPGMDLMMLDAELGHLIADRLLSFASGLKTKPDFISSHGHTVFHQPLNKNSHIQKAPFTTQIGNGAIIAALTGYDVISDFRSADVALGGQGAPLVPIGDEKLFGQFDFCLNLGGIANISTNWSISSSHDDNNTRIASDVCFVNMALNYLAAFKNQAYDNGGELAGKGTVNHHLLNKLNSLAFFRYPFPKSLGKEYFEKEVVCILNDSEITIEDKLRTFAEHITIQIMNTILAFSKVVKKGNEKKPEILVTGGGTYNTFLMELLKHHLPAAVIIPDKKTVEFKEALIFAFLGVLRIRNEINVLRSVTGAKSNSCSGALYKGCWKMKNPAV